MDRIEQLMKAAKPRPTPPNTVAGSEAAPSVAPTAETEVIRLAAPAPERGNQRGRTAVRTTAATVLAAAAVAGAVYVGGTMTQRPMPTPGVAPSESAGNPAPASPHATPFASEQPTATASPSTAQPGNPAAGGLSTGGVPCTMDNVDLQRSDQQRIIFPIPADQQHLYTVLGCAGGWLAFSISDEGAKALQLDGGNAWYQIAKLRDGRFLCDFQQTYSSVFNWEFQALNNQSLTPQQAMDKEFGQKGIPVELRPELVGDGPAAG
ncbi:hypothetical protein QF031_002503 [Pseudarthrobacter defluvii]|uniref:hypothetical protein n=1 Tax=Pseudarthrobacter defluvii TaxID=410837 RepID=UPI00278089B0|nr:hypothetical protein [Pseudarthrobacter defluvii]MDQ0769754.1 hypothetical protein [Pseudarthrobacter defluvii]